MPQPKVIRIDGVIGQGEGEVSAAWFRSQLPANGTDPIEVSFHTEGGSVFEGFAIYDAAVAYAGPKVAKVQSSAFSIGSFVLTAFDEVEMSPNAYLMLHNPRVGAEGDDDELSATAGMITKLKANMVEAYARRSGKTTEEVAAILKAETYLNAADAVAQGFADRITEKPVTGRAFARLDSLPHGVVTSLFGAGSGGEKREPTKGKLMSDSQPVAATVQEIKSAYPKANSDFIVRCIERSMPMASVAVAAAEEMNQRLEAAEAKVKAYEEAEAKAKAMKDEEEAKAKARAEEDDEAKATAKATGAKPVAQRSSGATPLASAQWRQAIDAKVATGTPKAKAVQLVNRENPGLREAMLAEANAR
jgi:ATP-dependent protease ClpP protease subunit